MDEIRKTYDVAFKKKAINLYFIWNYYHVQILLPRSDRIRSGSSSTMSQQ